VCFLFKAYELNQNTKRHTRLKIEFNSRLFTTMKLVYFQFITISPTVSVNLPDVGLFMLSTLHANSVLPIKCYGWNWSRTQWKWNYLQRLSPHINIHNTIPHITCMGGKQVTFKKHHFPIPIPSCSIEMYKTKPFKFFHNTQEHENNGEEWNQKITLWDKVELSFFFVFIFFHVEAKYGDEEWIVQYIFINK